MKYGNDEPIVKVSEDLPILVADNYPNPEILEGYTIENFFTFKCKH